MAFTKNKMTGMIFAAALLAIVTGCATVNTSTTSTPSSEPTATPVPINAISIDPRADSEGFLAALPRAEVDCAASSVGGREKLNQLVSLSNGNTDGITTTQLKVLASCVSNDTVQRVILGQLEVETGGLSDESVSCVTQYTGRIDFSSLFGGHGASEDTFVSTMQALFCLSPAERQALENSDQSIVELTPLGGIDALECAVDRAGPAGLAEFGKMFDSAGTVDPLAVGKFMPILIDCGVMEDDAFAASGVTADQFSCLFEELDEATLASFMTIAENPSATPDLSSTAEILSAMGKCGLDLQEILDSGPGTSEGTSAPAFMSTELLLCLTDNGVNASLAAGYAAGDINASASAEISSALAVCLSDNPDAGTNDGVVIPDGNGGTTTIDPSAFDSLPITGDQVQCLLEEVGAEQLQAITAGTASPVAILGALGTCNISVADLMAG